MYSGKAIYLLLVMSHFRREARFRQLLPLLQYVDFTKKGLCLCMSSLKTILKTQIFKIKHKVDKGIIFVNGLRLLYIAPIP